MRSLLRPVIVLLLIALAGCAYWLSGSASADPPSKPSSPKPQVVASAAGARTPNAARIDFNHDVIPILSANCFKCHGPDPDERKAGLRLDDRGVAVKSAESGETPIVPGKPGDSELVRRIFAKDPDERMPPKDSNKHLTDAQKRTLRRWIAEGAEYKPHWAFAAPKQSPLPAVKQKDWPKNPIDYYILARLEAEGLHPTAPADRYTLVRRVYLDLIGLPPTPQEADAFVSDPAPDAYERLVTRLLASPAYGERWARRWLDLARYADTNGYEKDRPRSMWPYRDWVIQALNADMPFDEFTLEQLAGDLLPGATIQQKIATGFHRNTMLNEEGGIDPQEFRYYSVVDRLNTTGIAWLGLTVGCAQCHTHKFDPITNREYYQLLAFFNNASEPELSVPTADLALRRKKIKARIARLTARLPEKFPVAQQRTWQSPAATLAAESNCKVEQADDHSWRVTGPTPARDTYTLSFDTTQPVVEAIRIEALKDSAQGPGRSPRGNFVLSEITATVGPRGAPEKAQEVKFIKAEADFSQGNWPVAAAIDGKPATGWAVDPGAGKPIGEHAATFYLKQPVRIPGPAHWTVKLSQQFGKGHTLARLRLSVDAPKSKAAPSAAERREALERAFSAWAAQESLRATRWTVLRPTDMRSSSPTLRLLDDDSVLASGDITKRDTYDLTLHTELRGITAVRLEAIPHASLPKRGPGMIFYEGPFGDFCLSEIELTAGGQPQKFASGVATSASPNSGPAEAIDGKPQSGWFLGPGRGKAQAAVFRLAQPVASGDALKLHMLFERDFAAALGHFRVAVTTDPRAGQAAPLPSDVEAALVVPVQSRTEAQRQRLLDYYLSIAPELAKARQQIDALRGTLPELPTTLVMIERPADDVRPTRIHHRGEFLQPKDRVEPSTPAFLPSLPASAPRNRLTLARWLVSPENPLTARVTANRQWGALFGRGLVRTTGDFGYQGEPPSHPELLDYLAVEFVKQGWSLKKLDRLIVTSATYRQSSSVTPELLARDPQNILLSRGPRFRLDAELVRDAALRASDLLSEKMGGPSVYPPQPPSITTEGAFGVLAWQVSAGEDRFRKSLYTFSKRTAPFAMYNTFDAPSGEVCVARRDVSNTPLQALTVLNDAVFVEIAQALGRIAAALDGSDDVRATALFRRCLTRPPAREELADITRFAQRQRQRFAAKELDPAAIAGSNTPPAAAGAGQKKTAAAPVKAEADRKNLIERATWTTVARALLNLGETITKN